MLGVKEYAIPLVDEAHHTQEGDLGRQMLTALPNVFLFGLASTTVNRTDKNTLWAFGSEEDRSGYMSRYIFHDSILDYATLPFESFLVDVRVDKDTIDQAL